MSEEPKVSTSTFGRCVQLTAAAAGLWLLLAAPAWSLAGYDGLEGLTYAALLCLVPGLIVFVAASRSADATKMALIALGGTGLRLFFVLVGALVLRDVRPNLGFREFTVWLLAYYIGMLFVETLLAVRMSASGASRSRVGGV